MVVCRLARVIQEKARTAIDAGRAKGVSNSFSLSASTFENWMRISIDRNVEVRFYLISFLHFLLIIVINSIENWKQFIKYYYDNRFSLYIFILYKNNFFFY